MVTDQAVAKGTKYNHKSNPCSLKIQRIQISEPFEDRGFQVPIHHRRQLRRAGPQARSRAVPVMARS